MFETIINSFIAQKEIWALAGILFIIAIIFSILSNFIPQIKGRIGESRVRKVLSHLNSHSYTVFNNVLLKVNDQTSQIDHVVISEYGVFVLETKNYSGWIAGKEFDKSWTRISRGQIKSKMINPVRQNWGHVQTLKEIFSEFPQVNYISIVVFNEGVKLNVTSKSDVIHIQHLLKVMEQHSTEKNIDEELKNNLISTLKNQNINSAKAQAEHVRQIKAEHSEYGSTVTKLAAKPAQSAPATNAEGKFASQEEKPCQETKMSEAILCPKCGVPMVRRKAVRGKNAGNEFYGCPNYPHCHEIINIAPQEAINK
jgi:hypothetical protein